MTNKPNGTLYIGSTSNLELRVAEHREGTGSAFTRKYGLNRLAWYGECGDYDAAINLEHRMKKWPRQWKINAIEKLNPNWNDLWEDIGQW